MNLTLHLTENCNMACSYCIHDKNRRDMSEEAVDKACEMIFANGKRAGFSFFGGEPLLRKDLIYRALDRCEELSKETGKEFDCMMTTNGTLLDDEFIARAAEVGMGIGLSFDGLAQNMCRHMADGSGSLETVEENAKKLLRAMPRTYAMMTIAPEAAGTLAESVKYLYGLGFRNITSTIAYGKNVSWDDDSLEIIRDELEKVAEFYMDCFEKDPFFFGPINGKIRDAITGENPKERCHLGMGQMPVAADGRIYACTQFIGDEEYLLGDVYNGLNPELQKRLAEKSLKRSEPSECAVCDIRDRCTHTCGCTNRMETGHEDEVSPLTCNYEQMIVLLADRVAQELYDKFPERFIKVFRIKKV